MSGNLYIHVVKPMIVAKGHMSLMAACFILLLRLLGLCKDPINGELGGQVLHMTVPIIDGGVGYVLHWELSRTEIRWLL